MADEMNLGILSTSVVLRISDCGDEIFSVPLGKIGEESLEGKERLGMCAIRGENRL